MKLKFWMFLAAALTVAGVSYAAISAQGLQPYQESPAYKQYQKRPKSELSKLIYLMDRFKGSQYTVLFDGAEYDSLKALKYAKSYIAKHYQKEEAENWLRDHAYRSPSGKVIYLKTPEGKTEVLRDSLIQELKLVQK